MIISVCGPTWFRWDCDSRPVPGLWQPSAVLGPICFRLPTCWYSFGELRFPFSGGVHVRPNSEFHCHLFGFALTMSNHHITGMCAGLPQGWTDPSPAAVVDDLKTIYPWMSIEDPACCSVILYCSNLSLGILLARRIQNQSGEWQVSSRELWALSWVGVRQIPSQFRIKRFANSIVI